ncbi:MAG TPA: SDR family oxidoreductase [Polyangiaceae bacterium]|nr:SDR family oxidoreductase [Polyangiaceae bacterium]
MGNRITLITGAAGALGSALCQVLVDAGHRIALVDRPEARARLAELARSLGAGKSMSVPLDVGDPGEWQQQLAQIEAELGGIDSAVLTAGGWQGGAPYHTAGGAAAYEPMLGMNLNTVHRSFEALLPRFVARKHGSIVVLGSRAVERPWDSANAAAYAASKAAVVALAQAAAQEVLDAGVRINAVLPSTIDTAANRRAMPDADFSRWVSPSSLGGVIRFLLSDEARDISGAALPVYGRA